MMNTSYSTVSAILFGLVALLHLFRAILGWEVLIGDYMLPVVRSWIVFGIAICFAAWGIRGSKTYTAVSALLFGLVGLLHLYRALVSHTLVVIGTFTLPVAASWTGFILSAGFCVWGLLSYRSS